MSVKFECPNCREPLQASEGVIGEQEECPECHTLITIPGETVNVGVKVPVDKE
jgi:Zn finger protein HypA/HybF involved in hydrogenase expression